MALLEAHCHRRLRWAIWMPMALLLAGQGLAFRYEYSQRPDSTRWEAAQAIGAFCQAHEVDALYADIWQSWINFASGEQAMVCEWSAEPYAPYEQEAELAAAPGIINDVFALPAFLKSTQSRAAATNIGPYRILYACGPAPAMATPLPAAGVVSAEDHSGAMAGAIISDGNCETYWRGHVARDGEGAFLVCTFDAPTHVTGVRLWCRGEAYPAACAVEGRTSPDGKWRPLLAPMKSGPFFWSGPRWYINGLFYRMAYRFNAPDPLVALRVRFPPRAEWDYDIELAELQVLQPASGMPTATWSAALPQLVEALQALNIERCYADRWLSGRIHRLTEGAIQTTLPSFMKRSVYSGKEAIVNEYADIHALDEQDALAVPLSEAAALQAVLQAEGVTMQQVEHGPWALFHFAPGSYDRESTEGLALKWVGFGCFKTSP